MFDIDGMLRKQLRDTLDARQTLIFPEGDDPRIVTAASRLLKLAHVVLVGSADRARDSIARGEASLECSESRFFASVRFVDPHTEPLAETLGVRLQRLSRGTRWELSRADAAQRVREPVTFAIMAVREGFADAVLGGIAHSSRDFFGPCLRLLEREGVVYEMGLFALPDEHPPGMFEQNLVMFADVALNPVPDPEALAEIAVGACRTMRDLIPEDVLPEIHGAVLSYSTRGSAVGPSVERIRAAEPLIRDRLAELRRSAPRYRTIEIVTEMQISAAVSVEVARTKLQGEFAGVPGAGRAQVLIVPSLDVGNLLYHIYATRYPTALPTLIIGGLGDQALDFSRSSPPEDVVRGAKALLLRRCRVGRCAQTPDDYFFPRHHVLAINPGSTSTKLALFEGEQEVARDERRHDPAELADGGDVFGQLAVRRATVRAFLDGCGVSPRQLDAVVGRGGLLRPLEGGTYRVCEAMLADLRAGVAGQHPSNLGATLAHEIAEEAGAPAYIVDPPVVDELDPAARCTGLRGVENHTAWHALSQRAAAKAFADSRNRDYQDCNLIVAHLGGGVSVGAHHRGRCVRVRDALLDGPMTPTRAGSLPTAALIELCYSGIPREELTRRLVTAGGLTSHLGTHDLQEVERRIAEGDAEARRCFAAMAAAIAAEIASQVPSFGGERVDRLILTGALCRSRLLRRQLKRLLRPLGVKITIFPGDREQEALRDGALRVLRGLEPARTYPMVDPMVDPSRAIAEEGSGGSGDPRGGLEDRSSCGEPAE